jgi:type II secretory pathway component PulM
MTLRERFERLEPRERQLLSVLGAVFAVLVVLGLPVGLSTLVSARRSENEDIRAAINQIQAARGLIERRNAERNALQAKYATPAPALAGFLAKLASDVSIDIPESQDRAVVPHGKHYEERSTKIVLHRVGMLKLVQFMEKIEQSGYPVSVSGLDIRKRGAEPDSYDVEMVVSAFDHKVPEKAEKKGAP